MIEESSEDLAVELGRRLQQDPHILDKNQALLDRVVLARVEDKLTWSQILAVLRQFNLVRRWEGRITKLSRELQGIPTIGGDPAPSCQPVKDVWQDAPVHDEAACPPGFGFGDPRAAVFELVERVVEGTAVYKRVPVSFDPIVIKRRIMHIDREKILIELAWKTEAGWKSRSYDRKMIASSREIIAAADDGLCVRSDNALALVKYLGAYENHNMINIEPGYANSSMGWQGNEKDPTKHGFLCGNQQIGGNGKSIELHSEGDRRSFSEVGQAGTLEGWREAVNVVERWPIARVGLYASLAAPLIAILDAPNCIVEWSGNTSGGKSVTLNIAQSCWKNGAAKLPTWNTTVNGLEARAQILNDMPFIVDDTAEVQESKRRDLLTSAVYMLESGHTRTRASKDMSERPSKTWRTIVLSTGEYTLAEHAGTGGAAARVLSFWGAPCGAPSDETGEAIDTMMAGFRKHHGHAGPAMVKWLCEHRYQWDHLNSIFRKLISTVKRSIKSPAAMRLAPTVALLEISAMLAHDVLGLSWKHTSMLHDTTILAAIERAVQYATVSSNKARQAWEHVVSFADSRRSQWVPWGEVPKSGAEPAGGWLGWKSVSQPNDEEGDLLAWLPSQLKRVLTDAGYPFDATVRSWRDVGVLEAGSGRNTKVVCADGTRVGHRLHCVRSTKTVWNDEDDE